MKETVESGSAGTGEREAPGVDDRIQAVLNRTLPPGAVVLLPVEPGTTLPSLNGVELWPFPHGLEEGGVDPPKDGADAIRKLEALRLKGADYFVLPSHAFHWLDRYSELSDHLRQRHRLVAASGGGLVFSLEAEDERSSKGGERSDAVIQLEDLLDRLLPDDGVVAVLNVGRVDLKPRGRRIWAPQLPPGDADSAAAQIEALRASGVEYLVIPRSVFGWRDRHPEFVEHLRRHHRFVTRQEGLCEIYAL